MCLIRPKCAWRGYDQTQWRSKTPLIRPKCARIRQWSEFSDPNDPWWDHLQTMVQTLQSKNDLWSDHLQTIVQTVVRSNFCRDPVISVWEHTGVRSTGSYHKAIWVCASTWGVLSCFQMQQNLMLSNEPFAWRNVALLVLISTALVIKTTSYRFYKLSSLL